MESDAGEGEEGRGGGRGAVTKNDKNWTNNRVRPECWMHLPLRNVLIAAALIVLGLVSNAIYRWWAMPTIRPHSGDGTFTNRSWRFPVPVVGMPIPGYTIDFPQFDLGA